MDDLLFRLMSAGAGVVLLVSEIADHAERPYMLAAAIALISPLISGGPPKRKPPKPEYPNLPDLREVYRAD